MNRVSLPKLLSDSHEAAACRNMIEYDRQTAAICAGDTIISRIKRSYVLPILFAIGRPNFEEARKREQIMLAQEDLLRLETARKLYRIERGSEPETLAALAPKYLKEIPSDRFGKDGAPYRMAGRTIYSIGPDAADQSGASLYDPSNGSDSAGDVFLISNPGS
jgi:hypothetical protein